MRRILLHASLDHKELMVHAAEVLQAAGAEILLPDLTRYQHIRDKEGNYEEFDRIKHRLSKQNAALVESSELLYVLNETHRGIKNYVGGNSFFEMSIAFFLNRPIWLMNPIPDNLPYTEEIRSFYPKIVGSPEDVILKGHLSQ
jgi:hypothetical protein